MSRKTKKSSKLFFLIVLILSLTTMYALMIIWEKAFFVLILIGAFLVCVTSALALTLEDKNVKKNR